jgi:hypothetical protein
MYRNLSFLLCFCSQEFLLNRMRISSWHCGICSGRFQLRMHILNWHAHFARFLIRLSILVLFHVFLVHRGFSFSVCVFRVGIVVPWVVDVETCLGRFSPCMRISGRPCSTLYAYFELACIFHPISELAHRNFSFFSVCAF